MKTVISRDFQERLIRIFEWSQKCGFGEGRKIKENTRHSGFSLKPLSKFFPSFNDLSLSKALLRFSHFHFFTVRFLQFPRISNLFFQHHELVDPQNWRVYCYRSAINFRVKKTKTTTAVSYISYSNGCVLVPKSRNQIDVSCFKLSSSVTLGMDGINFEFFFRNSPAQSLKKQAKGMGKVGNAWNILFSTLLCPFGFGTQSRFNEKNRKKIRDLFIQNERANLLIDAKNFPRAQIVCPWIKTEKKLCANLSHL